MGLDGVGWAELELGWGRVEVEVVGGGSTGVGVCGLLAHIDSQ